MKQKLKCTCRACGEDFEIEADYLIPGIEGHMNLAEGQVIIADPTRTNRLCDVCVLASLGYIADIEASLEEALE
ncbi:MAG: hypothetical protein J6Q60_05675 [Bacteroidaceae bacterium]|nr:hypothetical protein [Bacteroidaceae bacterium]